MQQLNKVLSATALVGIIVIVTAVTPLSVHSSQQLPILSKQSGLRSPLTGKELEKIQEQITRNAKMEKEARSLFDQGHFAEAKVVCYRLLAQSPKFNGEVSNMRALQLLGDIYLEQKLYKDAIDTYNRARRHTRNLELDLNTALAYLRLGDLKNAHSFYSEEKVFGQLSEKQKVDYLPQLPGTKNLESFEASLFLARGLEKAGYGSQEAAVKDFQKALRLFPRNGLIAYQLARELMRLKRYDEALPLWAVAVKFGKGEQANNAKSRMMSNFTSAQIHQAIKDVEKIK